MKKYLFIATAAMAMLASCSNDEVVEQSTPKAINFSEAFIDNAISARSTTVMDPSYTLDGANNTVALDAFDVYGFNNKYTSLLFDGTVVSKSGPNWTYSPIKYWRKGFYSFAAIAPSKDANVTVVKEEVLGPTINTPEQLVKAIKFNNPGSQDLILAGAVVDNTLNINAEPVNFTFKHLLSKIRFCVTNGFAVESNNSIRVTHATITAPAEGAYDTQSNTWNSANVPSGNYIFGSTDVIAPQASDNCQFEKLFIPKKDGEYDVTFKVESIFEGVTTTYTHTIEKVKLAEFKPGNCYNIKITINPSNINPDEVFKEIVFSVEEIKTWVPEGGNNVPFDPSVI